jgi:TRAP-type mannitol/chloroaromatic compound transport system substrate-binding protein
MSWKAMDRYSKDMEAMKAAGVKVYKTPESVLKAQLAAWTKIIDSLSKENPVFAEVIQSQKDWARRVVGFFNEYEVPPDMAYNHFYTS